MKDQAVTIANHWAAGSREIAMQCLEECPPMLAAYLAIYVVDILRSRSIHVEDFIRAIHNRA